MNRLKNYGLWIAVASLIFMVLQDAGLQITPDKFNGYVDSILTVLILCGIVSNPNSGKGFKDEGEDE